MTPSQSVYSRIGQISGIFLGLFFLARLVLLISYHESFADLSFGQTLFAFIHGIRFDAAITITFLGIPFMLMCLPHRWFTSVLWQGLLHWFIYLVLVTFVFFIVSDLLYFAFVHRHVGPEVTLVSGDMDLMQDMLLNEYRTPLILFVSTSLLGTLGWWRLFRKRITPPQKRLPHYAVIAVMFVAMIIIGRGGFQLKPARISDAFLSGSTAEGYLTLNGPFAIFYSARGSRPVVKQFMPYQTAVSLLRKQITAPHERYIDDKFPLLRTSAVTHHGPASKPNIVIFMLESWDAVHMGYFRQKQGLTPYSVTPNFDQMVKKGRLYTRFYAAGRRSMDGIAGILASVPTLPGMPYIGTGMAQNRLSYLAEFAKEQSYHTLFLQSSNRGSFRLDSVAAKAGFQTYLGAEDIPPAHRHVRKKVKWGVWDYSTFMEANRQFAKQDGPFLGFIFSSSTHNPWRVPTKQWEKFPKTSEHRRYLNSLYYADWALGQFMAEASKQKYFANTIFIITGDHVSGFDLIPNNIPSHYHIPLLIMGPGIKPGIDDRIGSQLDILPTVLEMANWQTVHSSVGRSLLDDTDIDKRAALCVNGSIIDFIEEKSWLSHNLHRRLDQHVVNKDLSANKLEKQILATHQVVMKGMLENRIYRKATPMTAGLAPKNPDLHQVSATAK